MTNFKNLANREDFASTREDFKDDTAKNKEDFSKLQTDLKSNSWNSNLIF